MLTVLTKYPSMWTELEKYIQNNIKVSKNLFFFILNSGFSLREVFFRIEKWL